MPMFEYKCSACGAEFEELVPVSKRDDSGRKCPKCGGTDIHRKMSCVARPVVETGSAHGPSSGGTCSSGTCPF